MLAETVVLLVVFAYFLCVMVAYADLMHGPSEEEKAAKEEEKAASEPKKSEPKKEDPPAEDAGDAGEAA